MSALKHSKTEANQRFLTLDIFKIKMEINFFFNCFNFFNDKIYPINRCDPCKKHATKAFTINFDRFLAQWSGLSKSNDQESHLRRVRLRP